MTNIVKPLFSDHYLTYRLPETREWNEDINCYFQELQEFYHQKKDILENLNESQTEDEWIKPILDRLGFSYIVQTSLHKLGKVQRPDYSLFLDENNKNIAYNLASDETAFYSKVVVVADAKYYHRPLSEKLKNDQKDTFKNSNPSFQIVGYLDGTRVDWGILTNGVQWRLYYRLSASPIQQYYEIDLIDILLNNNLEKFKYFWLFFRKEAFIKDGQNLNFLERVREESNSYARQIEDSLKKLVFNQVFANLAGGFVAYYYSVIANVAKRNEAVLNEEIASRGIDDISPNLSPQNPSRNDSNKIYQATLSFLYKILFLLYAEAKNLLPVDQESYREYSLSFLLKQIAEKCDKRQVFSKTSTQYYDRLLSLFKIIDQGDPSLNVPAYNGGLFKLGDDYFSQRRKGAKFTSNEFLLTCKISDAILAPALDQLARINREYIDYKFLGVRDLGSIYEGLLEYKLIIDDPVKGEVHLENDKGERRETGSYYTPEYIVDYIVKNTLDPILEEREKQFNILMGEIQQLLRELQDSRKAAKTIQLLRKELEVKKRQAYETLLDIKVCDPAMGSGHFLVNAVDYLTRKLIIILNNYPDNNPILEQLEQVKQEIINNLTSQGINVNKNSLSPDNLLHRTVMKRCIYGVDLNPMAVELAKVSLWLHSFTMGAPLSFLDHHLRCGNSLIGCMAKDVQNEFLIEEKETGILPLFQTPFAGLLQSAKVMQEIANLSDATFAQVEQSQLYFHSFDQEAKVYKQLLDVYICQYFGLKRKDIDSFFRIRLHDLKAKVSDKDQVLLDTARKLYEEKRFFHWDLEFPEVFIDLKNSNWKENGGFDAIIGNPPYISTASINKIDKEYYRQNYTTSGKEMNTFGLFTEKSIRLIHNLSWLSFIIPDSLLNVKSYQKLRELILESCCIYNIAEILGGAFASAIVGNSIIFVLEKNSLSNLRLNRIINIDQSHNNSNIITVDSILQQNYQDEWTDFIFFTNSAKIDFLKKFQYYLKLSDITDIRDGVKTGNNNKFVSNIKSDENYQPLLTNSDISRYGYEDNNLFINYDRKTLSAPRDESIFLASEKIITRQTGDQIIACLDDQQFYALDNTHLILMQSNSYSILYILALIHSKLIDYIYQIIAGETGRIYAQVRIANLEKLPIYKINFTTPDPRISHKSLKKKKLLET